jgi:hypothetical protein
MGREKTNIPLLTFFNQWLCIRKLYLIDWSASSMYSKSRSDYQILLSKQYKIKSQNIKTKKNKKKVNRSQALN